MRKQQRNLAIVVWVAFLMAIAAEGVFFSLFNPEELAMASGREWEALGAYTVGFFCFWGSFVVCGLLAVRLTRALPRERLRHYVQG
ncbi:hypothetical protein [Herbaspirillum huttiense]|uniref:Transmembrane protein n=2 Tax=Herbaspirillum huttiense TaxID=863372 RepID=A0AAJ2LPR2_9BURK|nr:hypothetical protein [Herbaspirillum huttiense]MDR9834962.1 hypothetical protein [Herbaspirillum huttiense]UWE14792.1 hypothetical protein NY669_16975 [Herbaspirillum huttiense]